MGTANATVTIILTGPEPTFIYSGDDIDVNGDFTWPANAGPMSISVTVACADPTAHFDTDEPMYVWLSTPPRQRSGRGPQATT